MAIIKTECVSPRGWYNKCQLQLSFYSSGSREQHALRRTFFFSARRAAFLRRTELLWTRLGERYMESMLNTEDAEQLVAPAECERRDLSCRMQMQTLHGDSSASLRRCLHTPSTKRAEGQKRRRSHLLSAFARGQRPFPLPRGHASSSAGPYVQPCHNHPLSTDECPLPHFTWKTKRALHC